MPNRVKPKHALILATVAALLLLGVLPGEASSTHNWEGLDRWDPATPSPTGQSVLVECNGSGESETWPEASARLRLRERDGWSRATFIIRDARPNTLYTVWIRLLGTDSEGNTYGGSPLTGIPVTPFVTTDDLPDQLAITLPNPGSADVSNGFWTNNRGNGRITVQVDFPVTNGAYPFQRFPNWDTHKTNIALTNPDNLARLGGNPAAIRPESTASAPQAPATFLIASHCVDDVAHGLLPGPHENWFTWSF